MGVKTIFLHGGLGYIGGHLIQQFLDTEHSIIVGTRRSASEIKSLNLPENVTRFFNFWTASDTELLDLLTGVDIIVDLVAIPRHRAADHPDLARKTKVTGSLRLLQHAAIAGVSDYIYLSSAHVYGDDNRTLSEEAEVFPSSVYAACHREAEIMLLKEARIVERIVVLRASNTFGSPAFAGTSYLDLLVNSLCKQALKTGRLVLTSNGKARKNFVPIADVAGMLKTIMLTPEITTGIYNLGSSNSIDLISISNKIKLITEQFTNKKIELIINKNDPTLANDQFQFPTNKLEKFGIKSTEPLDHFLLDLLKHLNAK